MVGRSEKNWMRGWHETKTAGAEAPMTAATQSCCRDVDEEDCHCAVAVDDEDGDEPARCYMFLTKMTTTTFLITTTTMKMKMTLKRDWKV